MSDTFMQKFGQKLADRDGMICHYCGKRIHFAKDVRKEIRARGVDIDRYGYKLIDMLAATVDHVIPRSKGGTDDLSNLVLACNECNRTKGAK
jgi:5-methylcytosine-specific restriction endonuclease McrA